MTCAHKSHMMGRIEKHKPNALIIRNMQYPPLRKEASYTANLCAIAGHNVVPCGGVFFFSAL
mgnify:CR=1 FL=1